MARAATTARTIALLPRAVETAVRRANIPPHLRTLLANLPGKLEVTARLPRHASEIPPLARQLVKLGMSGGACHLGKVELVASPAHTQVVVRRAERRHVVERAHLHAELATVVGELLQNLYAPEELPQLLEQLAFQSSTLTTLQSISRHMLRATDLDAVHHAMLAGITAGYSLGFNRAALFVRVGEGRQFVGSRAVGPASAKEAHAIWEQMELEEKSLDELLAHAPRECELQTQVQALELTLGTDPRDEVVAAAQATEPLVFRRARAVNPALRELGAEREMVVAAVRARTEPLGFILADNIYSGTPITPSHVRFLHLFLDQAALVWENLILLRSVERLARHDSLTGLLNRREFDARVVSAFAQVRRTHQSCAMLVIDLDHFKKINDERGHAAGDEALRVLGAVLQNTIRNSDLMARYGGDEFVVFLPSATAADARSAARRVGKAARAKGLSLSIGGALHPGDCQDPAGLLSAADQALYRAKAAGRGCACVGADNAFKY